jgi:signal peptidase I
VRNKTLTVSIVTAVLILAVSGLTIRIFFIQYVRAPMGAMMNTIIPGDQLLVTRAFGEIERGRIVVFQYPNESTRYLARVVGLPGETIQVVGKVVYINKRSLAEQRVMVKDQEPDNYEPLQELSTEGKGPYRVFFFAGITDENRLMNTTKFATFEPFRIPEGHYFIMGDNRDATEDGRYRGPVPRDLIWGGTSLIYYSETIETGETRWERVFKRIN